MNILFVLDTLANGNANVHAAIRLAKNMAKNNNIYAIAPFRGDTDENKTQIFNDVKVFNVDLFKSDFKSLAKFQEKTSWQSQPVFKRILLSLTHPNIFISVLYRKYINYYKIIKLYKKEIEETCKKWHIDAVIGFSMPYENPRAIANSGVKAVKTLVQFDPFTNNHIAPAGKAWEKRKKIEIDTINKLNCVFVVDFVFNEMSRLGLGTPEKLVSIPFPAIEAEALNNFNNQADIKKTEKNKNIKFFYTGGFYEDIRNPEFLFSLFEKLPENYEFHFVGSGTPGTVKKFQKILGKRLVCYGWRSSAEVKEFLKEADILVCLNNSITNQMSSKLLEYIFTGKPVLNVYKVDDCPSLKYISKYSNYMNLKEAGITPEMINQVVDFTENHIGKVVNFYDVVKNYQENTDLYVSKIIEDKIRLLVEKRDEEKY